MPKNKRKTDMNLEALKLYDEEKKRLADEGELEQQRREWREREERVGKRQRISPIAAWLGVYLLLGQRARVTSETILTRLTRDKAIAFIRTHKQNCTVADYYEALNHLNRLIEIVDVNKQRRLNNMRVRIEGLPPDARGVYDPKELFNIFYYRTFFRC